MNAALSALPPNVPQYPPSLFAALCRGLLRLAGWRLSGEFPDVAKLVVIAAPHSSNWDAIIGMLFKVGLRLQVRFIGKREAFVWPLGPVLRALGGIPIDRSAAHGVVEAIEREFATHERFWFALAPEGTRKKVQKWKSGFWHIARAAGVPILPVYFHYPGKTLGIGPLLHATADLEADMARIREFYRPWQGKNHGSM
jgi:1-acyl-sn-glycerol-3-phosphate acyltransferase